MTPRLNMIGLVADDLRASLAFYRRLGLDLPEEAADQPHVEVTIPGGLRIAWDTVEVARTTYPDWQPPAPDSQRMALAFLCDSPAEVDTLYAELIAAGHPGEKEPWDAFWGQRYAVVRDPDGNTVDLFAWQS